MTTTTAPPRGRGDPRIVVFGRRAVLEALRHPDVEVELVRSVRDQPTDYRHVLHRACREADVVCESAARVQVNALSREARHDQGVAARVRLGRVTDVSSYLERSTGRAAREPRRLLAFDRITNPQNIGMIVRSAVASGMDGLLWPRIGCPWMGGLVVKASAGAVYHCPVLRCDSLLEGLVELAAGGFEVAGLCADARTSLFDFEPPHRCVFVMGSETEGLAPETREIVDHELTIPMDPAVESLNVAVAASLVCFRAALTRAPSWEVQE